MADPPAAPAAPAAPKADDSPADINERIAEIYLDDRKQIQKAGKGLRTTAKWMMTAIAGVGTALSGGAAIFTDLGHLSGYQWLGALAIAFVFLVGIAVSIYGCSTVLESQNPSTTDAEATQVMSTLGSPYAKTDDLTKAVDKRRAAAEVAAKKATDAAGQAHAKALAALYLRDHAALEKLLALVWYEKLAEKFKFGRWFILAGAIVAGVSFVGFVELTQMSAANAKDAQDQTTNNAKDDDTDSDEQPSPAPPESGESDDPSHAAVVAIKHEERLVARLRLEALRLRIEAAKMSAGSDEND